MSTYDREPQNTANIVIKGGTVVDGSGTPGLLADVAITNDRITAIGPNLPTTGATILDATGHIVSPGFIDIHTHYDAQVFWDQQLTPSCFHGVTTVVAGNCGFSLAPCKPTDRGLIARTLEKVEDMDVASLEAGIPWDFETFPEYLDSVRARGVGLNFGAYVGHTALRIYVMGTDATQREATDEEIATMSRLVIEAMDAGAVGFASSTLPTHNGADGRPIPSRFAGQRETEALLEAMASTGKGVAQLTTGSQTMTMDEMYVLQTRIGRPFTYTALLTHPSGAHTKLSEIHERGRALGGQVWPQITPRPLVFQTTLIEPFTFNVAPCFAALMSASIAEKSECFADPAWRSRAVEELDTSRIRPRWDAFSVGESASHPELTGRRILELAAERGVHALDVMCEIALDDKLTTRFKNTVANDDEDAIRVLLQSDTMTLGLSDAGAHVSQICDAPQATDLLGNWVRERSALTIEQAVRKLTGQQADIYGLRDRGYLREGAFADITVFDPKTVAPGPIRRVRDFPADAERLTADAPVGMTHTLVNGTPIRVDGAQLTLTSLPGRVVTPG
jgi:N-acyl-D-amino-acid deacylase